MRRPAMRVSGFVRRIDWLKSAVELVVVVVSVTLAFMLNSSHEKRQSRKLERKYLSSFLADISADGEQLDHLAEAGEAKLARLRRAPEFVSGGAIQSDSILAVFQEMMRFEPFTPNLATYESLRNGGAFGIIDDYRLKEEIAGYYQSLEMRSYYDGIHDAYLNGYIMPFTFEHIDFARMKLVNAASLREYRFTNIALGCGALIQQNLIFYRDVREKGRALAERLGASIE